MIKIQEATEEIKTKKTVINKDAAKRVLKNALWQLSDHHINEKKESS